MLRLSHASQPRWNDIWALRKGKYELANEDFPGDFKDEARALMVGERLLMGEPDPEIRFYRAQLAKMKGHRSAALRLLRHAELDASDLFRKRMRMRGSDYSVRAQEKGEWDSWKARIKEERRSVAANTRRR